MGSGGSAPQPQVIHPGEAAQAAVGTAGAGEMMSIANQPIEQLSNLATTSSLGPAEMQAQQALAGRGAYQAAQQQQDIQSRVDPLAFAQRQMRLKATTDRLGKLYSQDPTAFSYRAPDAYTLPGTGTVPDAATLRAQAAALASNISTGAVDRSGTNPRLVSPSNPQLPVPTGAQTYF
jgi:hypothetical protein